jgi:hypothetical protein
LSIDRWSPGPFLPLESGPEKFEALPIPAYVGLWLDDHEGRAALAPEYGKPNPEEAIKRAELGSWTASPIDGQLLSEGEIFQGQIATKFEDGNERRDIEIDLPKIPIWCDRARASRPGQALYFDL